MTRTQSLGCPFLGLWRLLGVASCVALAAAPSVPAGSGEEHRRDYEAVLGLYARDPQGARRLAQLSQAFQNEIDEVQDFYSEKIKGDKRFERFTWGESSHRLLFHWGFQGDPKRHKPLVVMVERCGWTKEVEDAFYDTLLEEQSRRYYRMVAAVRENLGVYTRREKRAIAAIIYDVHLLGDIAEHSREATGQAVQDVSGVIADLRKAVGQDLFRDGTGRRLAKDLEDIQGTAASDSEKAQQAMDLLKEELPSLMEEGDGGIWRRRFEEMGVGIR